LATIDTSLRSVIGIWAQLSESQKENIVDCLGGTFPVTGQSSGPQ
jgi:hypothetical protein